jgi:histidine ammonia-lyase
VFTLEMLGQLQALSFRNSATMGKGTSAVYSALNGHFSVYDNTRVFHDDLVKFRKLLFSSQLFDDLEKYYK